MSRVLPAIANSDRFIIVRVSDKRPIEGHYNEGKAHHAMDVLNNHNKKNNHAERFTVLPRAAIPELNL